MKVEESRLGAQLITLDRYYDDRGYFNEVWRAPLYSKLFLQDNISKSKYGVIRGLHYQRPPYAQAKLIHAVVGRVFDVIVDIDTESPTFGEYETFELAENQQLFVPANFAHGFQCLSSEAIVHYKCTELYNKDNEKTLFWKDSFLNIPWPIDKAIVSEKDNKSIRTISRLKVNHARPNSCYPSA